MCIYVYARVFIGMRVTVKEFRKYGYEATSEDLSPTFLSLSPRVLIVISQHFSIFSQLTYHQKLYGYFFKFSFKDSFILPITLVAN